MNKLIVLACLILISVVSCKDNSEKQNSGINLKNLDTKVRPQDDFYQYACGGWMEANPLTPEHARYGTFDQLRENNITQLKNLIEKLSAAENPKGSVQQKVGDLYKMGMDENTRNQQGNSPIQEQLKSINSIADRNAVNSKLIELHTIQIHPFFLITSEADFENSENCIPWIFQGGMGLGDRDYYLENDDRSKEIRTKYIEYITKMFELSGYDKISGKSAEELAKHTFNVETKLATVAMGKLDLRNMEKIFNKMSFTDLQNKVPDFAWMDLFTAAGIQETKELNVGQPEYIKEVTGIIKNNDLSEIKSYMAWTYINFASSYLSNNFVAEKFNFYGKVLSGKEEQRPNWKITVDVVNSVLGEAVGQAYVAEYFPAESKTRMLELVKNVQTAFGERMNAAEWMSAETKAKAHEKLASFKVKIGYPDKWRDYSGLEIKDDSYLNNILRSNKFDFAYIMNQANKPLDKEKWGMNPQTVNAYYNPTTNEICFPAGILQPPFFNADADDAVNYGAIGVVIAHEMSHGFDDQGAKFDKDGNMKNWWTDQDKEKFNARTKVLADYFDKIEVLPGVNANGNFTLGENIADNGGLQIAFQALQKTLENKRVAKIDEFTPEQRFFIAYATLWASNIRNEEIERLTKIDVHSLGKWRTNGTLPHVTAFEQAFDVKLGDKMYLEPEKRALIW